LEEDAAEEVVCGGTWKVCFSRRTPLRVLRGKSGPWTGDRTSRYLDSGIPHSLQGGRKKSFDLVMRFWGCSFRVNSDDPCAMLRSLSVKASHRPLTGYVITDATSARDAEADETKRSDLSRNCERNPKMVTAYQHGTERVTSNTVVVLCAIAILLVVIVFLELHIRPLTSIAAPATSRGSEKTSRGEHTLEGSSRVAAWYVSDGQDQVSGLLA
jgi:hypothetical protein